MKVNFFALLRSVTGQPSIDIEAPADVGELISVLDRKYSQFKQMALDDTGRLTAGFIVLVNGENVHRLQGLSTPLKDSDTVSIFPPLGGG